MIHTVVKVVKSMTITAAIMMHAVIREVKLMIIFADMNHE